jgi:hypothetical protein
MVKQVTTDVGIDAHKKDPFVAMLRGTQSTPVTWQLMNKPSAVCRLVRKPDRERAGPVRVLYGPGSVWLRLPALGEHVACQVRCDRPCADSADARQTSEGQSPRRARAGGFKVRGGADRRASRRHPGTRPFGTWLGHAI